MTTTIELKVIPQAGKQEIAQNAQGVVTCRLKSAAEDGKANAELIKLLAKLLHIPQADIRILVGATSRKKTLVIASLDKKTVLERLGIQQQLSLQG